MLGNVLIVDDSGLSRRMVKKCVTSTGLEASEYLEAADGAEALDTLKSTSVDLLITDLNMPNVDGYALVDGIEFGTPMAPRFVVVISSTASETVAEELISKGVSAVVCKPISPDSLKSVFEGLDLIE